MNSERISRLEDVQMIGAATIRRKPHRSLGHTTPWKANFWGSLGWAVFPQDSEPDHFGGRVCRLPCRLTNSTWEMSDG
jgi:hypothetical protein